MCADHCGRPTERPNVVPFELKEYVPLNNLFIRHPLVVTCSSARPARPCLVYGHKVSRVPMGLTNSKRRATAAAAAAAAKLSFGAAKPSFGAAPAPNPDGVQAAEPQKPPQKPLVCGSETAILGVVPNCSAAGQTALSGSSPQAAKMDSRSSQLPARKRPGCQHSSTG